jgi:phage shock protein PspC (stress-responsive transcriptional regulator)
MVYCSKCGKKNSNDARYCKKCGNSIKKDDAKAVEHKRLYRSGDDKLISGVCGGIAEYFDIEPIFVRIIFLIALFFSFGFIIILYILFWIFIQKNPNHM